MFLKLKSVVLFFKILTCFLLPRPFGIIEFNRTTIDTEEEKENNSAKPFKTFISQSRAILFTSHDYNRIVRIKLTCEGPTSNTIRSLQEIH